ncbi:PREDICTED: uncharacterized protein LOC107350190 [Acropora digitifera]|uniref:uncharacterized protein LOC107350190 n=1 Tax=Acropora digitifera TaxID=70779 RepID=UPI00077A92C6|nr:PREDICTED: uncharacterized protein LOC107350190 [Acropora digitifera]
MFVGIGTLIMLQDTSAQVIEASSPHKEPLYITLLASERNSLAGGLSTLNRELAIHLAQQTNVRVSLLVPEGACNDRDKREAQTFDINIVEAKERYGYEPLDWLGFPPEDHRMDVVIGHGVKLGRQVQAIKCFPQFRNCKWVQTVHTAPEDLGKYKGYENPTSRGEQKHWDEVRLCKCADLVFAVGPKLMKAYSSYLQGCNKQKDIFGLTPGLFDREFGDIVQIPKTENDDFKVLLCGRGDNEDFELKGYDIAVKAFADLRLKGKSYHLVFVGARDGMQDELRKRLLNHGISEEQLTVRKFVQCRSGTKELLCEVDLAIMPSKCEGFGLVALEALSAGLPVLVGSNSGFASAIRDLPLGAFSIVDSDDPAKWAEAVERVCVRHRVCLEENKILRELYGRQYVWETQCKALVERFWGMISDDQGTSISQALAADDSTELQTVVLPEGISRVSQKRQSAEKQGKRRALAHLSGSPPGKKQRRDTDTFRVFNDNSVIVKLLIAEYNRRAQLRPLFWDSTIQLPLEKVYTTLKIVSRRRGGNQGETQRWSNVIWAKDSRRDVIVAEARANKVNPCDVFGMLKENKDVMTIVEGSPGIGKTIFSLKLAFEWANQSSSAASFPEFELVLLLKCRDIKGDLTEAITEQLFPKDMSKDAREELFCFLEDVKNQERVLIILDGLDEMAENSKPSRGEKIRICLDPGDLNKAVKREHYPIPTVEEIAAKIPDAKVFTVLDAKSGYLQMKLDYESSLLTTMNTPIGRYRWLKLPFGIKSAPEMYQRAMDEMLEVLEKVLDRARSYNLKLNFEKVKVRKQQVQYVGHIISAEGLKPDPEKVRAMKDMPPPETKEDVRRFLGSIQYLAKFLPMLAEVETPLRELTKKDVLFHWDKPQADAFQKLKNMCCKAPVLAYYDVRKEVTIQCDAISTCVVCTIFVNKCLFVMDYVVLERRD